MDSYRKTKPLFMLFLLLFFASCQHAMSPATTSSELIALNERLIDALARGDRATVDAIYADSFVRTSVSGEVITKKDVLEALRPAGDRAAVSYESKDIDVHDYGDAAVLVYLSIRHTEGKSDFFYRVTDTFVRQNGRWRKAASAGTPILPRVSP